MVLNKPSFKIPAKRITIKIAPLEQSRADIVYRGSIVLWQSGGLSRASVFGYIGILSGGLRSRNYRTVAGNYRSPEFSVFACLAAVIQAVALFSLN